MLKNIWPINKLYNLSDRVYQLKSQYLELCEANEKLQKENESLNKKLQVLEEKNNKLEEKNNEFSLEFASYKKEASDYDWFSKFGYDRMISDLQMSCVENILPGNRERLAALKDTHKGESCFIIGNGPSLKAEDLELLKNNNIFCFASKRINLIYDKTSWRPDIWAASDLDYVETYLDEIKEMKGYTKLLCAQVITRQKSCQVVDGSGRQTGFLYEMRFLAGLLPGFRHHREGRGRDSRQNRAGRESGASHHSGPGSGERKAVPLPAVRRVPVQLPFRRADAGNLYGSAGHRHGLSGIVPGQEGHFQKASSQPARGGYAPARRFAVPETALER